MKKSERTRQYIIERTAPVFNKKGYAGTSMSDLTEATGLTKGAIYGNFENKDEVALAAFTYNVEQITLTISQMMESRTTPWEKLMVFPEFYRSAFKKEFLTVGCPIANTAPEADDTHPELRHLVNKTIIQWDKSVQKLVQRGIETGQIKAGTNPSAIASLMICLIEGGLLITKTTGNIKYFNTSLDQVEQLLHEIKN